MLAAGLAVFGAAFLLLWGEATSPDAPSAASSGPAPGGAATSAAADADTVSTGPDPVPRPVGTRPVRLRIPGIGVVTDLVGLGLQGDGTVEVPVRAEQAGWYRLGPRPGDSGSAVVLGHVDSAEGPAVFARLATLEPGDRVHVDRADGTVATFRVRTVTTYANEEFPAQQVYGPHGRRELNLVTCGGAYIATAGGYQANVVVNTVRA